MAMVAMVSPGRSQQEAVGKGSSKYRRTLGAGLSGHLIMSGIQIKKNRGKRTNTTHK